MKLLLYTEYIVTFQVTADIREQGVIKVKALDSLHTAGVTGSIPVSPTMFFIN